MPDSTARGPLPGPSPASAGDPHPSFPTLTPDVPSNGGILRAFLRRLRRREKNEAVREAIEGLIEETPESDTPISDDQRTLLVNILKLRDKTVRDVMVPRVDIVGIAADTPLDEVVRLIQAEAHSRYPVYRESLDDVIGMMLAEDERREIDTVGGLIFSLLGRIPERGEVVRHPSGVEFEILDVDPRRIRRLRVRPPAVSQSAA